MFTSIFVNSSNKDAAYHGGCAVEFIALAATSREEKIKANTLLHLQSPEPQGRGSTCESRFSRIDPWPSGLGYYGKSR